MKSKLKNKLVTVTFIAFLFINILFLTKETLSQPDKLVKGVDVSGHQHPGGKKIDWSQVYKAGYTFAFVKATEGAGYTNSYFSIDVKSGRDAGILMGVYHFARPDLGNNAKTEAEYFIKTAGEYLIEGYLRPVLDLEKVGNLSKKELSEWVKQWMETVEKETGIEPILYTYSSFAKDHLDDSVTQYDLWIAHYTTKKSPDTANWKNWNFWQYTSKGSVPGIEGNVDLNVFNGNVNDLNNTFCYKYCTSSPINQSLIRTKKGTDVFWYQNGKRYHVLNPDILNKMARMPGWGWNLVYEFDPSEIEKISQGPKFIAPDDRSNGILIRQQGTNEVYKIENGKRQYVSFDECNRTNCWNNVIEVTSEIIGLFNQIPTPSRNFLVCAAGEDSLIDDLEIVELLDAWQKQRDYRGCGVPTNDDYMKALASWIKRQPVFDDNPLITQNPVARFTIMTGNGQTAQENEEITLVLPQGEEGISVILSASNSYDPDGGAIRTYEWQINGTAMPEGPFSHPRAGLFLGVGIYKILLIVTDDERQTGAVGATIVITEDTSINNPPIISSLTYEPRSPTPDDTIYFEVLASDPEGDPLTYEWYLNGVKQTNATAARVQWANPSEGTHTMAVKASDNKGGTAQATVTFTVASPSRGQTPQIVSVDIPNKITINTETRWELSFYDPNGDINWIRFEHYKNGQWVGIGEGDPKVYGQMRGTISIITTCDTLGIRTHRAILRDARGNESIPYEYSFECVAGYRQNPPVALLTISGYDSFSGYRSASNSETLNLTLNFASSTEINFSSNSYDPNSENLSYEWFINGQLVSTTDNFTQTLEAGNPLIEGAREYEVVLRVTNRSGLQAIAYARIIIAVVYVEVLPGYIIKSSSSQTFIVTAMNKMIDLHIYDSGGRLVYHIAELPPRYQWRWNMRDQYGARVPNGVYLVVITVRDLSGYPMRREVKKIVVLG